MSMSRGCLIIERFPGQWYVVVARSEYDFDFRTYTVYGPKPTDASALSEMDAHESNPGQYSIISFAAVTPALAKMVDEGPRKQFVYPPKQQWRL